MQKSVSRRSMVLICSSSLIGISGCGDVFDDEESEDEAVGGNETTGDESQHGDQDNQETDDDDSGNGVEEAVYDEEVATGDMILNIFDLPDEYNHLNEELLISSELSEGDSGYDFLSQYNILRRHQNEFIEDTDPEEAAFVTSIVYICESIEDAEELKESRVNQSVSGDGQQLSPRDEFEIPTTVIETENEEGDSARRYLGRDRNAVFELLAVGNSQVEMETRLYIRIIT